MKKLIFASLFMLPFFVSSQPINEVYKMANQMLGNWVDDNGNVNYPLAQKNLETIKKYHNLVGTLDLTNLSKNEQVSTIINTYNLKVIEQIAANYPVNSVNEIPDFFDN